MSSTVTTSETGTIQNRSPVRSPTCRAGEQARHRKQAYSDRQKRSRVYVGNEEQHGDGHGDHNGDPGCHLGSANVVHTVSILLNARSEKTHLTWPNTHHRRAFLEEPIVSCRRIQAHGGGAAANGPTDSCQIP